MPTPGIGWLPASLRSLEGPAARSPSPTLGWDALLAVADAEGLAPALGFVLKAKAPAAVPLAVREQLKRRLADGLAGQLIRSRELGQLLQRFESGRIPVIPLKGPALAETLYPDPALRPCTDLDLLIRREHLDRVDNLLLGLGYRRLADAHSFQFDIAFDRATLYEAPSGIHVDLHLGL